MSTLSLMPTGHESVLEPELIALLDPAPGETAVDCTFGFGGHSRALAGRIGPAGELIAIDRDPAAELRFGEVEPELASPARFIRAEFSAALVALAGEGVAVDVIALDLGVSSMQLDQAERGFSYSFDAPLDMRMDPTSGVSAAEAVNDWTEARLAAVLRDFGEERHARAIAREIAARRPFTTTGELVEAIRDAVPPAYRFGRGHPAKRSFQALRIAVNGELDSLARTLPISWEILPIGGRLGVISFHSLEDRPVKRFLAERSRPCICPPELPECRCGGEPEAELLTRRAVVATESELERNPRASSARLRVARKLTEPRI